MNKLKDEKHIISLDEEKIFDKIQHPFVMKVLERVGIQETYLSVIKTVYSKHIADQGRRGVGVELVGEEEGETIIRIYYIRKKSYFQ